MDRQPPVVHPVNEGFDTLRMDMDEVDEIDEIEPVLMGAGCPRCDLPDTEGMRSLGFDPVPTSPSLWAHHLLMKEEPW